MEGVLEGRLGWWRRMWSVLVVGWLGAWVVGWLRAWVVGWLRAWVVGWLGAWVVGRPGAWMGNDDFHVLLTDVLYILVALLAVLSVRHKLVFRVAPERAILHVFCGQVQATSARTCSHTLAWEPWLQWPGTSGPAGGNVYSKVPLLWPLRLVH